MGAKSHTTKNTVGSKLNLNLYLNITNAISTYFNGQLTSFEIICLTVMVRLLTIITENKLLHFWS